jgi:hypothetical protein
MHKAGFTFGALLVAIMVNILIWVPVFVASALLWRWIVGQPGRPGLASKLAKQLEARRASKAAAQSQASQRAA